MVHTQPGSIGMIDKVASLPRINKGSGYNNQFVFKLNVYLESEEGICRYAGGGSKGTR